MQVAGAATRQAAAGCPRRVRPIRRRGADGSLPRYTMARESPVHVGSSVASLVSRRGAATAGSPPSSVGTAHRTPPSTYASHLPSGDRIGPSVPREPTEACAGRSRKPSLSCRGRTVPGSTSPDHAGPCVWSDHGGPCVWSDRGGPSCRGDSRRGSGVGGLHRFDGYHQRPIHPFAESIRVGLVHRRHDGPSIRRPRGAAGAIEARSEHAYRPGCQIDHADRDLVSRSHEREAVAIGRPCRHGGARAFGDPCKAAVGRVPDVQVGRRRGGPTRRPGASRPATRPDPSPSRDRRSASPCRRR